MSDRGRVVLIFAAVALIAGGAGFYFFAVYQPQQQLADAQAEIARWEARYQEARACLLGKSPGSSKTSEALAIREMAPDPWDRGKCTPLVSKLSRGVANDTGVEAVEAAWTEIDETAQAAARAFVKHVASSTTLIEDPLPGALDALDAARARLRTAAKLPPTAQAGTALPAAQIIPIADGKDPVTDLTRGAVPSAHGLVAFGRTESRQVQIALPVGGTPKVVRVGAGSIRAVPDLSWGATAGRLVARGKGKARDISGELVYGPMNEEGAIATPTSLTVTAPLVAQGNTFEDNFEPGDEVGSIMLAGVAGSLADGALVYGAHQTLVVAHAKNGAVTPEPPIAIDFATTSTDTDGRLAVVWTAPDKTNRALLVRPGGQEAFELPASFVGSPCMTADRVWVVARAPEVFSFGGGRPLARLPVAQSSGLQGCTADAAIVRGVNDQREVAICGDLCRKVSVPSGAPDSAVVAAVDGKLRAIAMHGGVLGVWSEDKPPVFYALPVQAHPALGGIWPAMGMTDGKVIDILARSAKSYVVIRIPAA